MDNFRLNDRLYHMVHSDNLENIFTRHALLSYHMRQKEGIASFADWELLGQLNWEIIYSQDRFYNAENKRIKHAEVLIPDILPIEQLKGISVISQQQAEKVNKLAAKCGLEGSIPRAVCKPDLYY